MAGANRLQSAKTSAAKSLERASTNSEGPSIPSKDCLSNFHSLPDPSRQMTAPRFPGEICTSGIYLYDGALSRNPANDRVNQMEDNVQEFMSGNAMLLKCNQITQMPTFVALPKYPNF